MSRPRTRIRGEEVIGEMGDACVLMRTRLIARVITAIHDDALRPFGIGSAQFVLLLVIYKLQPATRTDIGRHHRQDRSTLTRNLKLVLSEGWAEEVPDEASARKRPIVLTMAGKELLMKAAPAWRTAQAKSKAVLGKDGAEVVTDIANSIITAL